MLRLTATDILYGFGGSAQLCFRIQYVGLLLCLLVLCLQEFLVRRPPWVLLVTGVSAHLGARRLPFAFLLLSISNCKSRTSGRCGIFRGDTYRAVAGSGCRYDDTAKRTTSITLRSGHPFNTSTCASMKIGVSNDSLMVTSRKREVNHWGGDPCLQNGGAYGNYSGYCRVASENGNTSCFAIRARSGVRVEEYLARPDTKRRRLYTKCDAVDMCKTSILQCVSKSVGDLSGGRCETLILSPRNKVDGAVFTVSAAVGRGIDIAPDIENSNEELIRTFEGETNHRSRRTSDWRGDAGTGGSQLRKPSDVSNCDSVPVMTRSPSWQVSADARASARAQMKYGQLAAGRMCRMVDGANTVSKSAMRRDGRCHLGPLRRNGRVDALRVESSPITEANGTTRREDCASVLGCGGGNDVGSSMKLSYCNEFNPRVLRTFGTRYYRAILLIHCDLSEPEVQELARSYFVDLGKLMAGNIRIFYRGIRRLGYRVGGVGAAHLLEILFHAVPAVLHSFKARLRVDKQVLRFLVLKVLPVSRSFFSSKNRVSAESFGT